MNTFRDSIISSCDKDSQLSASQSVFDTIRYDLYHDSVLSSVFVKPAGLNKNMEDNMCSKTELMNFPCGDPETACSFREYAWEKYKIIDKSDIVKNNIDEAGSVCLVKDVYHGVYVPGMNNTIDPAGTSLHSYLTNGAAELKTEYHKDKHKPLFRYPNGIGKRHRFTALTNFDIILFFYVYTTILKNSTPDALLFINAQHTPKVGAVEGGAAVEHRKMNIINMNFLWQSCMFYLFTMADKSTTRGINKDIQSTILCLRNIVFTDCVINTVGSYDFKFTNYK